MRDPDYITLIDAGLYGNGRNVSSLSYYLAWIFTPVGTWYYLKDTLIQSRIWGKGTTRKEQWVRFFYYLFLMGVISITQSWRIFFLYWIVPTLTTANWVGSIIELSEHYPMLELFDSPPSATFLSRNRLCGKFSDFFFGIHREGYHLVHHLYPRMPQWVIHQAHQILLTDHVYAQSPVSRCIGWMEIFQQMFNMAGQKSLLREEGTAAGSRS